MTNIAINGFGRIGRLFFRQIFNNKDINILAINDLGDIDNLAYLLKYDTVYGNFDQEVEAKDGVIKAGDSEIKFFQEKNPKDLPWGDLGVDIVVEATGIFTKYELSKAHLEAGAKRVVITAPAKDDDGENGMTCLMGVNEEDLKKAKITSNGSCTTNASASVIKVLDESLGVEKAMLNTVHGYTASQSLVDSAVKDGKLRAGRAAAQNIVPFTTGAAIAVSRAVPQAKGRFDGVALRVPVIAGSVADITFISKKDTTAEEVNDVFRKAAGDPKYDGILSVTEDPIVSSDVVGQETGALIDLPFTKVVDGNLVKILSWYDNEAGYVSTLVRHVLRVSELV